MHCHLCRYFAIVHPLKHFSGKKFLLLISTVASVLYNIPKFYEFERTVRTSRVGVIKFGRVEASLRPSLRR